jgi:uncharacterized membrane protein
MALAITLHLLGVIVWVGGMVFANVALRPSVSLLPPPQRLTLLAAVFGRFLAWVGGAIVLILGSGAALIVMAGGMRAAGPAVHGMTALGLAMMLVYVYVVVAPFRRLRAAVACGDWPGAGAAMDRIRVLVAVNLVLGLVTVPLAVYGR